MSALSDLIWSLVQVKHAAQKSEPKLPLSCSLAIADGGTIADLIPSFIQVWQDAHQSELRLSLSCRLAITDGGTILILSGVSKPVSMLLERVSASCHCPAVLPALASALSDLIRSLVQVSMLLKRVSPSCHCPAVWPSLMAAL